MRPLREQMRAMLSSARVFAHGHFRTQKELNDTYRKLIGNWKDGKVAFDFPEASPEERGALCYSVVEIALNDVLKEINKDDQKQINSEEALNAMAMAGNFLLQMAFTRPDRRAKTSLVMREMAKLRHTENYMNRAKAEEWLRQHRSEFKSREKAASALHSSGLFQIEEVSYKAMLGWIKDFDEAQNK